MHRWARAGNTLILILLWAGGCAGGIPGPRPGDDPGPGDDGPPPAPVAGHPRLWITADDLPRLRSWAADSNPIYRDGLAVLAAEARAEMDAGDVPALDSGSNDYEEYPTELYAELFAFMSLIAPDAAGRDDYARRARRLLMHVINEAVKGPAEGRPFRDPEFYTSASNRARWQGEAYALTADWIYPYLSEQDKSAIRSVFLRWSDEIVHQAYQRPQPEGVINDPVLVEDPVAVRWAGNNYFTAFMRNLGLMAMALDEGDDPGGTLRAYLSNATGAWMYMVDHLLRTEAAGGQAPEGFEYSPQTLAYVTQFLLALHTAGLDDPAAHGAQVVLRDQPFWDDMISAYFHALSPAPVMHEYLGPVYQPAWYGDGQTYLAPDFIAVLGPLGLYDRATGNDTRLDAVRWSQVHLAPGGEGELLERVGNTDNFLASILYFLLMDPQAPEPSDPRPEQPLAHHAPGVGHILARTSWDRDATWFTFSCGYVSVDHQHGDGNLFEFYRRGEWLTKERTGYGDSIGASDYHNTLALENDRPEHDEPTDPRGIGWRRGSQWLYGVASGDGRILAHSMGDGFVYALGEATDLYNSDYEGSTDILHASRSIVWLQPDHIVIYDRAASRTSGRFKRFWLNLPAAGTVAGHVTTMTTAGGQQLFATTLLPDDAAVTVEPAEALDEYDEPANDEPMQFRLRVEAPGGPPEVRFLHVLQGADAGSTVDEAVRIDSTAGTPFCGAAVAGSAALFPRALGSTFIGLTYEVPAGVTRHLVTGLPARAAFDAEFTNRGGVIQVQISAGARFTTDSGGVLELDME